MIINLYRLFQTILEHITKDLNSNNANGLQYLLPDALAWRYPNVNRHTTVIKFIIISLLYVVN